MDSGSSIGWLLDVIIEQDHATIWIKTIDGTILKLRDKYKPSFYALPKDESTDEISHILSQQPKIKKVEWKNRLTDLFDNDEHGIKRLICVYLESLFNYKILTRTLEKDQRVAQLFNTDLSHVQQYLFTRLKIEPTSKVEVQYDRNDSKLITLAKISEVEVALPPFSILYFELDTELSRYNLGLHDVNDPITKIRVRYEEEAQIMFQGNEEAILTDFCRYVLSKDPDILISTEQYYQSTSVLRYLFARISELGLHLGRENQDNKRNNIEGRIYLDSLNLIEIIEKSRFAFLPLGLAARYGMIRLIDSRNCFELINRGFVIPQCSNNIQEHIRTVEEIITRDKGGMIFSPQVGLHENVAVLDYEDEYANLILKHNLSYETVPSTGDNKSILPTVLESVLKRRTLFKNLQ
ncbi:MAG: DNA polymerase domain-containing protein, partial [Candidatus Nitrosopolaris sp.]